MSAPMQGKDIRQLRAAAEELHSADPDYKRAVNLDFLVYLVTVVLVALAFRAFIAEPVRVIGPSMIPTLTDGEYMFTEKLSYYAHGPERGDIIICFYPGFTVSCVKRVIALPGERIAIQDGHVYINGRMLNESEYWTDYIQGNMPEQTVPANHVFVMGDNRNVSEDSRYPTVGPIPYEKVLGRVVSVVWPFPEMHALPKVSFA